MYFSGLNVSIKIMYGKNVVVKKVIGKQIGLTLHVEKTSGS